MGSESEKNIRENVREKGSIHFSIVKCPLKIYEKFTSFCEDETSGNYSLGLKILLDSYEESVKEDFVFENLREVRAELAEIREKLEKKRELPKTFGSGGKE